MAGEIARGEIRIDVNDKEAIAGLRAIDAEFDRTMSDIDRQHAEITIDAKLAPFEDKVAQAKRLVRKLEGEKAEIDVDADTSELDEKIAAARKNVKQLDGQKATVELDLKRNAAEWKSAQADLARLRKAEAAAEKARQRLAREQEAWMKKLARTRKALNDQRTREELASEREAYRVEERRNKMSERWALRLSRTRAALNNQRIREETAAERAGHAEEARRERALAAIPKLRARYAALNAQIEKLYTQRRHQKRDQRAVMEIDFKVEAAEAEMKAINKTLERVGSPVDLEVNVYPGRASGASMREAVEDGMRRGGVRRAMWNAGVIGGLQFREGLANSLRRNLSGAAIAGILPRIGARLGHMLGNLSEMTVRLGPFTATIRQAFTALSLLAPLLLDVVGAFGALIAVTGSAALGGIGVATAGFGAFGLVLGSTALLLPPLLKDFKNLNTMQEAYHKAVLKNGKGSEEAKKKLAEFNQALKGVSPTAKQAFLGIDKLKDSWRALSEKSRPAFFEALGQTLETARASIKKFGPEITQSFALVSKGWQGMMKGLRGEEAQDIIQTLFDAGQASLPAFGRGLMNLAHAAGNLAAAFSKMLAPLGKGFESWTEGIEKVSEDSARMNRFVERSTSSMQKFGHFAAAAGRFLGAFFGGGVGAGQDFLVVMTNALNRWTAFLHTAQGQSNLKTFFSEAVEGARSLWNTLAPLIASFARWAALIAPAVRGFLEFATVASQAAAALLRMTALQGPMSALLATLGVLWGIGKVSAATRAISNYTRALLGMSAASTVAARAGTAAGVAGGAGFVGAVIPGRGTKPPIPPAAAKNVTNLAKAGSVATKVMTGLGLATLGVGSVWAGAAVAAGALGFGVYKLITRTRDYEKQQKAAMKATTSYQVAAATMGQTQNSLAQEYLNSKQAALQLSVAEKNVNRLRREGKVNTDEFRQATLDLNQARLNQTQVTSNLRASHKEEIANYRALTDNARKAADETKRAMEGFGSQGSGKTAKMFESFSKGAKEAGVSLKEYTKGLQGVISQKQLDRVLEYEDYIKRNTQAQYNFRRAQELSALAVINHARSLKGQSSIAREAAGHFARLARLGGQKLTQKVATQFDDAGSATKVARSAAATLRSGVPRQVVTKIIADSSDADAAVRRLSSVRINPARLKIVTDGGQQAINMVQRLTGVRLPPKLQRIAEQGGKPALNLLTLIRNLRLAGKTQAVRDNGGALVLSMLRTLANTSLPDKHQRITIETIRIETVRRTGAAPPGADTGKRDAEGQRGASIPYNSLIGEGRGPEWHVDENLNARRVDGPTFTRLGRGDAVIPTEPRYRSTGREILKEIAGDLGMKMFAGGKKAPKGLSDRGKQKARGEARKKLPTATSYSTDNLRELDDVEAAKRAEDNYARQISINESKLKEPSSFVMQVGTDPATGDPTYAIDQNAISQWQAELENMARQYDELVRLIAAVETAVRKAMNRIGDPYGNPHGGIIGRAYNNIGLLTKMINHENAIIGGKKTSKAAKEGAKERKKVYQEAIGVEKGTIGAATTDWKSLDSERNDIGFRRQIAENSATEYRADEAAVAGKAAADAKSQNPSGGGSSAAGATALDIAQQGVAGLEAEQALAAIGQGLMGGAPRDPSAINASLIAAQQGIINQAQAMLHDADPTNDSTAFGAISGAANAISGLQGGTPAGQASVFSQDLMNLYKSFSGNYAFATPQALGAGFAGGDRAAGDTGTNVNITQTFQQMPDPHTWSRAVAFELQAAL